MSDELRSWLKSGDFLPPPLRDFHDQKDTFKTMHTMVAVEKHAYAKDISWVAGQCYVIDIFLWWMAKHGYTLQKSRTKLPFENLDVSKLEGMRRWRDAAAVELGLTPIKDSSNDI